MKKEEAIRNTVNELLRSGKLNPTAQREEAKNLASGTGNAGKSGTKTHFVLKDDYLIYTAAYADNNDYVICATELSSLFRFARKRSWSLWFLVCAIMVLLGVCTHCLQLQRK